ncbi:MAG: hypothetical protein N2Z22_09700, partial [Turneriella sp.]|nr:hypothetical protein [Turneriella sp.]
DEPRFVFSPQARPGRYRLRVSAVLNEMQETPPSPEITVTIEGIPDISWQLPDMLNIGANTRVLDPKIGGPGPPYKLRFILSDKEENTVLEQDLSGKKERKLVLEEPLHGTFNAKLLLLSPDRQVLKSLTKTLRISYQPPKVRQFVGLPTLWKPAEQEKLSVRWQAVPEASGYKLSAELRASGKDSSVNLRDVRVQKNSMEFLASEVRAAGTLVVSVQALQEVGDTLLASEPLVAEIPVEYYQKPQKIKIVPGKIRVTE